MAISQTQIVDYLNKKVGYSIAKTDVSTAKYPFNESIPSPLLTPGQYVWQQDYYIPSVSSAPSANTVVNGSTIVAVYNTSTSAVVQSTSLSESISQETWNTGITNWIPPSFGSGYQLKLYAGPPGASAAQVANFTQLPVAGSGANDSWFFDYQAGIVNFADTSVPAAAANVSNVVYAMGAVYTGTLGIANYANLSIIGNVTSVNGNIVLTNGAYYGNGSNLTGIATAGAGNVSYYSQITPLSNNQTYYLEFANLTVGNSITGAVTTVNVNPSTSTISAGTFNGTSITLTGPDNNGSQYNSGALQIVGGAGISGNLYVAGNVYAGNLISTTTQILEVTDPLLYLNANTPSNYNYEIGFYSHFGPFGSTPYQHTGFVRDHTAGIWKLFANTPEPAGGTVNFTNSTWEALQIGNLFVANTTAATGTTQATGGALYVAGGAGIAGALYAGSIQNTPVGSTTASTGSFTSLNAASGLTASTVQAATIGNAAASGQFGTVTACLLYTSPSPRD